MGLPPLAARLLARMNLSSMSRVMMTMRALAVRQVYMPGRYYREMSMTLCLHLVKRKTGKR